jgi:hypothetical protein
MIFLNYLARWIGFVTVIATDYCGVCSGSYWAAATGAMEDAV